MVQVVPWLVEREYQQHKNLNYEVLPETFAAWREKADAGANRLAHAHSERVVKVVIHPREFGRLGASDRTCGRRQGPLNVRDNTLAGGSRGVVTDCTT